MNCSPGGKKKEKKTGKLNVEEILELLSDLNWFEEDSFFEIYPGDIPDSNPTKIQYIASLLLVHSNFVSRKNIPKVVFGVSRLTEVNFWGCLLGRNPPADDTLHDWYILARTLRMQKFMYYCIQRTRKVSDLDLLELWSRGSGCGDCVSVRCKRSAFDLGILNEMKRRKDQDWRERGSKHGEDILTKLQDMKILNKIVRHKQEDVSNHYDFDSEFQNHKDTCDSLKTLVEEGFGRLWKLVEKETNINLRGLVEKETNINLRGKLEIIFDGPEELKAFLHLPVLLCNLEKRHVFVSPLLQKERVFEERENVQKDRKHKCLESFWDSIDVLRRFLEVTYTGKVEKLSELDFVTAAKMTRLYHKMCVKLEEKCIQTLKRRIKQMEKSSFLLEVAKNGELFLDLKRILERILMDLWPEGRGKNYWDECKNYLDAFEEQAEIMNERGKKMLDEKQKMLDEKERKIEKLERRLNKQNQHETRGDRNRRFDYENSRGYYPKRSPIPPQYYAKGVKKKKVVLSKKRLEKTIQQQQEDPNSPLCSAVKSFEELKLPKDILDAIHIMGYSTPSAIQGRSLPVILNTKMNVVAQSQSGTGKTTCFVIGILEAIDLKLPEPQAIIISPTLELAHQTYQVILNISCFRPDLKVCEVTKGKRFFQPVHDHVICGTPGSIVNLIERRKLPVEDVKLLVLDEADYLLEQPTNSLRIQATKIKKSLNTGFRVFLFSATYEDEGKKKFETKEEEEKEKRIRSLAVEFVPEPVFSILVRREKLSLENLDQYYMITNNFSGKVLVLDEIYRVLTVGQMIIFINNKKSADMLKDQMEERGHGVSLLHGGFGEHKRRETLANFRDNRSKILIATNVLSRGLDIPTVSHVINFDVPQDQKGRGWPDYRTYLHRIGRTARFGATGYAITLVEKRNLGMIKKIEKFYQTEIRLTELKNLKRLETD